MTTRDEERFAALLAVMFDVFQAELKSGVEAIYWDALAEYDWATVRAGIESLCRNARHYHRVPRPGDLRIECGAPTAETLWQQLDQALADGYFAPPPETAPIVRRLIKQLGGWRYITEHMDRETLQRRVTQLAPRLLAAEQLGAVVKAAMPLLPHLNSMLKPVEADDDA